MSKNNFHIAAVPLLAGLVLSACSAPALRAPEIPLAGSYRHEPQAGVERWAAARPAETAERGAWWKVFHDATLDQLVAQARAANPGLAKAAARVKEARALAGIAAAQRTPAVDARFGAQRERGALQGPAAGTRLQAGLAASYEPDLFGRSAARADAATADASASEGTFRSVLLALQADVASVYLRLRTTDAELEILGQTVQLREATARINRRRHELGDLSEIDLARAQSELSAARAEQHAVERQREQLEHALAILLGQPPAAFRLARNPLPETLVLPRIPAGLPATLLERRPDISAAQLALVAANARAGEARAARFPAIRLTVEGGGASSEIADVLAWSSRSWVLGALSTLPLLDGGRTRANIARTEAGVDAAAASYRQTVLTAFGEVEDNLVSLQKLAEQADEVQDALLAARRAVALAARAYETGSLGYLELLDMQRSLATLERDANSLRGERAACTVALIRSLGGSW